MVEYGMSRQNNTQTIKQVEGEQGGEERSKTKKKKKKIMKMKMVVMAMVSGWWKRGNIYVEEYKAHILMILSALSSAVLLLLLQSTLSVVGGSTSTTTTSPVIIVFYQHLISTFLLFSLALLCKRDKKMSFSFHLFCWAFLLGFLQITLSETLITSSLRLVPAKFQSTVMNTSPIVIFVLAVIFRRESFEFCSIKGQAKLWGVALSFLGATVLVLWPGPELREPTNRLGASLNPFTSSNWSIGILVVVFAVMAVASAALLLEYVAMKYDSDMCLAAMISLSGAIQTGAIAALKERSRSAWLVVFHGGLETTTIIFGGLVVTGLMYYVQTWCIHKRGPVFASAFSPLLMVFSFMLETLIFNKYARVGSILGSLIVVIGLYLLLWGKVKSKEEGSIWEESDSVNIPNYESLGLNSPLIHYISGFPNVIIQLIM